ncbi:MAG: cupin domain-containing protein [Chloroflexota bacterium]|nr:cupin domain-containing protein [Chloroflexota bacterium]
MRIVRIEQAGRRASAESIFVGPVDTQTVVDGGKDLRLIEVHFKSGARNKPHTHTTDQILVVTEGTGIVGAGGDEREVRPGDVAFIPAGEVHWHGAKEGHDMTHLAINGGTSQTTIEG